MNRADLEREIARLAHTITAGESSESEQWRLLRLMKSLQPSLLDARRAEPDVPEEGKS